MRYCNKSPKCYMCGNCPCRQIWAKVKGYYPEEKEPEPTQEPEQISIEEQWLKNVTPEMEMDDKDVLI